METAGQLKQTAPTEPDPREWIESRVEDISLQKLRSSMELLRESELWFSALNYWTRLQIVGEVDWDKKEETEKIDCLETLWLKTNSLEAANITREKLRKKLRMDAACSHWSHKQWGHRVDSLYLQKKNQLDRASCRIIRISNKDLASELYHRVKADESSFEEIARLYGEGPERMQGGLIPMQTMLSMPFGLAPLLERLRPGEISTPLRLGKIFCMVELLKLTESKLDERTEAMLLADELKLWIVSVVEQLDSELCSGVNP